MGTETNRFEIKCWEHKQITFTPRNSFAIFL